MEIQRFAVLEAGVPHPRGDRGDPKRTTLQLISDHGLQIGLLPVAAERAKGRKINFANFRDD